MKFAKLLKIIIMVFFLSLYLKPLNIGQRESSNKNENKQKKMWQKLLKEYPVPRNATELELMFSFPSKDLIAKDIYLYGARFLSKDTEEKIYVSDSRAHRIFKFDSSGNFLLQIGHHGQGPGEFNYGPFGVMAIRNFIAVNETGRVQFFDENGNYAKSFKIYKTYREMAADDEGFIFATPVLREDNVHLVHVLSPEGKLLYSFGKPLEFKYDRAQLNYVKLALNKRGELFLAFKYFPIVRKYSKKGKLLAEFRIEHNFMKTKEKINFEKIDARARGKRAGYAIVLNAVRATNEGFYILHTYPRLEILEYDMSGKFVTDYWKIQKVRDYYASDFLVNDDVNEKVFYVLLFSPENRVDVFGQKHEYTKRR